MSDRNKTSLTKDVTAASATWLDERGFRLVESEVPVDAGWTADLAGFCYPTKTEAQSLKILRRRPAYNSIADTAAYDQWHSEFEALPCPVTALIEVKTSINDYRRDNKFYKAAPTNLRYVAIPRGMVAAGDVASGWGVLAYDPCGRMTCLRPAHLIVVGTEKSLSVVGQIAMRRDAFTRYERFREFDRQAREHRNGEANLARLSKAVDIVLDVQAGKLSADNAHMVYCDGRYAKLPRRTIERLRQLHPAPGEGGE